MNPDENAGRMGHKFERPLHQEEKAPPFHGFVFTIKCAFGDTGDKKEAVGDAFDLIALLDQGEYTYTVEVE